MPERTLARLGALCAALLFSFEGACFLDRPGPNVGELVWGPLKSAIYGLLFAPRPQHIWTLRWPMLLAGAAVVAIGCCVVRRMAGPWGWAAAAILLATDPALILSSRLDSADLATPRFFLLLSIILFLRFWRTASRWYLAGAFAASGLACSNLTAIPVMGAIAIAGLITFNPEIRAVAGWRNVWPSAAGLVVGLLPLLLSSPASGPRSAPPGPLGVLDGSAWFGYAVRDQPGTWGVGPHTWAQARMVGFARAFGTPRHDMLAVGLLAAIVAGSLFVFRSKGGSRPLRFSISVLACGYLALAIAGTRVPIAWSLLTPFVAVTIAVALSAVAKHSIYGAAAAIASLAALALSNLAVTATFYSSALLYGGAPLWTEAAYRLADDLDVRDAHDLCILTPGTGAVLQFLRHGRAHFTPPPGPEDALYVAATDEASVQRANQLASAAHRHIIPVRLIQDFQGRSVFVLYRME